MSSHYKTRIDTEHEKNSGLDVDVIEGHRVLCSVTGSDENCNNFLIEMSLNFSKLLEKLANHSKVSPQNVYKSFINILQHKMTFLPGILPTRTVC